MSASVVPTPGCPGCQARDQRIARLEQTVAELQRQLDEVRQQLAQAQAAGKRQAAPFRRRQHADQPKRPGRPKGHLLAARPVPDQVDRVVEVPCTECPDCHVPLVDPVIHPQYQTDLPPVVPVVTRFDVHGGTCPCCRRYHQGRHPEMISDAIGACANQIGPVALSLAAELKHRLGLPYRKITDFFATYFDLDVSAGTLARAEQRLARKAQPTFDLLVEALRACGVVHADETGWRIGKLSAWLWVFSSATVTIYAIRRSRGHEVAEEILGAAFDGILVVDGWAAYDVLSCTKGRCHAHILRRCRELLDQQPAASDGRHWQRLLEVLRAGLELWQRRQTRTEAAYAAAVRRWEDAFDRWLLVETTHAGAAVQKLRAHLLKHHDEFLRYLLEPEADVPPTNNHAERMLRPAVISRKVGGCNKTLRGALVHGILASLMVTLQQQGKQFVALALQLWRAPEPGAIDLSTVPAGQGQLPAGAARATAGSRPVAFAPSG
jgi:transposase